LTPAAGAGHGDEGDASFQGPAQETDQALPASPKPTNAEAVTDAPGPVIELVARMRETGGLVMTRPKPEKRLNAKDRAINRALARRAKDKPEAAEEGAVVTPEASGLSTAHPKPEKRKNAKERAREKYAKKKTADGTTPDTTAKAKSKVTKKAEVKAKKRKAAA
jgi:hypothetical protein